MSAEPAPTRYTLRFSRPQGHLVEVTLAFPVPVAGEPVELWMPVWTPGSYLVREYSRHLEAFTVRGEEGELRPWRKTGKNRWEVDPGRAGRLEVGYRIYGRELSVRTNWIEEGFAFLNGAPTFLFVRGLEGRPHRIDLEIPGSWGGVWTSLQALPAPGSTGAHRRRCHSFRAADHDELIDSPILAGNPAVHEIPVEGVPVSLVNLGEGGLWDGGKAAEDTRTIVAAYEKMYGSLPFDRYLFFNLILEGRGGLEHKKSSVLMTSRYAFRKRKAYLDWLNLVSHEFFHVWNVKRSRPEALGPFDYEGEVYTRSLWVAEGITNYYTSLVPCRAGLATEEEYLETLSRLIESVQTTPGRALQSLEDSSFDSWIKLYRPDENTANTTISYYVKGAVAAWLLDVEIRRATGNRSSLDDLMRALYERYSGERGFTDAEVQAAAEEIAGRPLAGFFEPAIRGTAELEYGPALEHFGLRFRSVEENRPHGTAQIWLGLETRAENGRLRVARVRRDGPAYGAGINAEDEIVAVNGYRVGPEDFEERLQQYRPGERLQIMVARRGAIRIAPVDPAPHPGFPWRLAIREDAPPGAAAARRAWLRRS